MSLTDLIALLIAGLTLASAGLVIFSRNAVYSAFYLLLTLLGVACEYVLLQAHFIAVVQVLVYAGAVVVLLVFVLMMMGFGRDRLTNYELPGSALILPILLALTFLLAGGVSIFHGKPLRAPTIASQSVAKATTSAAAAVAPGKPAPQPAANQVFGSIDAVGKHLITHNVLAFEIISILLLMAMVGVILLLRDRNVPAHNIDAQDALQVTQKNA